MIFFNRKKRLKKTKKRETDYIFNFMKQNEIRKFCETKENVMSIKCNINQVA